MLLPFFQWCETLWLGQFVVGSNWLFPVIEAVHLLALSVLGGAVLVVDLRLLGLGLKGQSASELWRAARPWMIGALADDDRHRGPAVPVGTDQVLLQRLVLGEDDDAADRDRVCVHDSIARHARTTVRNTARRQMLVGALSIALWVTVAAAGRWIGFS